MAESRCHVDRPYHLLRIPYSWHASQALPAAEVPASPIAAWLITVPENAVTDLWHPLHSTATPALVMGMCAPRVDICTIAKPVAPAKGPLPSAWQVLQVVATAVCSVVRFVV